MREHPWGKDLLELARNVLRRDLIDQLPKENFFTALMLANAMAIAARQLDAGDRPEAEELAALAGLYGETCNAESREEMQRGLNRLYRRLCREIRGGSYDPGTSLHAQVFNHLMDSTTRKVRESNPKYLGG
jgi:transposase